jgi:hypothetical protein
MDYSTKSIRTWDFKSLASTSSATSARVVFSRLSALASTHVLQFFRRVLQNLFAHRSWNADLKRHPVELVDLANLICQRSFPPMSRYDTNKA